MIRYIAFILILFSFYIKADNKPFDKHNIVNVTTTGTWLPFNYKNDPNDKVIRGMGIDYWDLIAKKAGLKYKVIEAKNFGEVIDNIKDKKYDINIATSITEDKKDIALFTKTYEKFPIAIATYKDEPFIGNGAMLEYKKVAVGKNYSAYFLLKEKYPKIEFVFTSNTMEALKLVYKKEVYAAIDIQPALHYQILKSNYYNQLKITGITGVDFNLQIMVRNDYKELLNLINKSIDLISKDERISIYKKWMQVEKPQETNLTFIWILLGVLLILLIYTVTKQLTLKEYAQKLEDKITKEVEKNIQKDKQLLTQSRLAQMGEMISMIAHQWRQPLSAISNTNNNLMLKAQLDKADKELILNSVKYIDEYVSYLNSTIEDFREFFRPETGKRSASFQDMVKSVLMIIGSSLKNKDIKLIEDYQSKRVVQTYINEIKQVILNLIKNSEDVLIDKNIKNPFIKIKIYEQNNRYILEVSDNGGGIDEDILDKIFDPYFSTKNQKDGTGLGLYMSKTIIEEHCGGVLSVYNKKDGALFKVEIDI